MRKKNGNLELENVDDLPEKWEGVEVVDSAVRLQVQDPWVLFDAGNSKIPPCWYWVDSTDQPSVRIHNKMYGIFDESVKCLTLMLVSSCSVVSILVQWKIQSQLFSQRVFRPGSFANGGDLGPVEIGPDEIGPANRTGRNRTLRNRPTLKNFF